jgi:MoxR-like ATPase
MPDADLTAIKERVMREGAFVHDVLDEVGRVVVGQTPMIERLLIGLLCNGHVLLEGVPGLAKTLTVRMLAQCIGTSFQRIQFTPDLLPADVLGTLVYNQQTGTFTVEKGPIFANVILADEINRSPAKVQSALLESMQEHQVTIGDQTFPLDDPFLVLATQNPIEQQGTYPLPEAQMDRFMMKVQVPYPSREEELEIMRRMAYTNTAPTVTSVATPEQVMQARQVVNALHMDARVEQYIVDLVLTTRTPTAYGAERLATLIEHGASPRASINLNLAARGHAFLRRRAYVTPDDVRAVAPEVLAHRVVRTYEAEAQGHSAIAIVQDVLDTVEVP